MKLILSVAFIFFPLLNVEAESLFKEPVVHSAPANELGLPMSWVKSRQGRKELDDDYVVFIGSKGINKFWNTNFDGYITNVRISGEDAAYFNVDSTTCNPGVDYCESYVSFTPQQERYYHASILQDWYPCNLGDECEPYLLKLDFSGLGILEVEPGECDDESPGSIIKNDDRAVIEQIPIIGTDFQLSHSSRTTTQFKSGIFPALGRVSSFNPEGWSLSVHHLFKPSSNVLFMGDGNRMRRTPFATTSEFIRVVNGSEVFVFDLTGKHLETRSSLTGYVKYAFFYNDQDKLIKIKDAYGKETIFSRDLEGRLESITSPYGKTTTIALSSESGLISSVTNSNAESFSILYYPGTELIDRLTRPSGNFTFFEFNSSGRLTVDEGNGGNYWDLEAGNDGNGSFTLRSSALERMTTYRNGRDEFNNYVRKKKSPSGFITEYFEALDKSQRFNNVFESGSTTTISDERFGSSFPRLWKETFTINGLTKETTVSKTVDLTDPLDPFSYSTIQSITNTNGVESISVFNKTNLTSETTNPSGVKTLTQLDNFERPVSIKYAGDVPFSIFYDQEGRVSQTTQGSRNTLSYTYGTNGEVESVVNALYQVTSFEYNDANRVTRVTYPDGRFVGYTYNPDGLITSITPPGRDPHRFTMNAFDLPGAYTPPTIPETSTPGTLYSYNLDKQLTQILRPDGKEVNYIYGPTTGLLDQIILATEEVQNYTYYPATENPQTIQSPDGVESSFTYFGMSTFKTEEQAIDGVTSTVEFLFDNFFRETERKVSFNGAELSTTITTYRPDSQPSKVGSLSMTYDETSGRLTQTSLGKVKDFRTYDEFGYLKSYRAGFYPGTKCRGQKANGCATELFSYNITRDALNRIVTKVEKIQGQTTSYEYSYDSVGRLSSVTKNGVVDSSFIYDDNSNRISGTQNGVPFTATFDAQDRQLTYALGAEPVQEFVYNTNGELIQITKGTEVTTFNPDALGRLKSVTLPDSRIVNYALDWEGRRAQRSLNGTPLTRSIYEDTYRLAAEINLQTQGKKEYVFATSINSADYMKIGTSSYRIIKDHLGSPRLVVKSSNGQVVQRMDYNEWGKVTLDTNPGIQPFGFAGGLYDPDTKLVKFGARDYDGSTGRWLSKDPIRFEGGDTNLYGYVLNDPVNLVDANGLQFGPDPSFYEREREIGETMSLFAEIYLDEKHRKENEAYNEAACKARARIQAKELQKYFGLPNK